MRFFLGMISGVLLTVVVAYAVDSTRTSAVAAGSAASANRTMVNRDVVEANWASVKARAKEGWTELRARVDPS
jgi:hypothetical protein